MLKFKHEEEIEKIKEDYEAKIARMRKIYEKGN